MQEHQLSERRACRLVGLSRDSYRHPPVPSAQTQALKDKIVEIAHVRRRFGYRRVHWFYGGLGLPSQLKGCG